MKIILPVAGLGTRLRPHTLRIQKALLPVAGKAALDHIVEDLLSQGLDEIDFIIGHLGDQVRDHMQKYRGRFRYLHQSQRQGLGHAVLQGLEDAASPVLVHLGDTIFKLDLAPFCSGAINRLAVGEVADPSRFGVVETDGDRIVRFFEKVADPPSNLAITGLYYFHRQDRLKAALVKLVGARIQTVGEYQLTDAMDLMIKAGEPFEAYRIERWYDVGVPETYLSTNRLLLKSSHPTWPSATLHAPVYIGEGCRIQDSDIGPYVTIMDGCRIETCRIDNSIVLSGSHLVDQQISGKIVAGDGSDFC